MTHSGFLPNFVTFRFPEYSFNPDHFLDVGSHVIEGKLWNPFTVTNFKILIHVSNNPPYLPAGSIPEEIYIETDTKYSLKIPDGIYREGQTIIYKAYED